MTPKERIEDIERYLETDHEGSFSNSALSELLADALALRELVEKLPKCDNAGCSRPATFEYRLEGELERGCDEHRPAASENLLYASVLREMKISSNAMGGFIIP